MRKYINNRLKTIALNMQSRSFFKNGKFFMRRKYITFDEIKKIWIGDENNKPVERIEELSNNMRKQNDI